MSVQLTTLLQTVILQARLLSTILETIISMRARFTKLAKLLSHMIMTRVSQSSDLEAFLDTWASTVLITASLSMEILQTLKSQEESRTSLLPTDRHCLKSVLAVQLTLHLSSISSTSMLSLKEDRIHTIFCCY